ncbi:MAG: polysaccharide biosynthesis protein, partial [Clostridia bacterium]|nr:polysaccharide biosynthesis protein [Clostridia bacterium]
MLDFAFVILAMMAAIALRYENNVMLWMHHYHTRTVLWQIVGVHMFVGILAGVYGMVWRYAGATEIARLVVTYGFSTLITLLLNQFVPWHMSRPILVITGICVMMFVIMSRFTYKLVREWMKSRVNNGNDARVLIVGAGEGGVYAARICLQNRAKFGQPVAFADDDPLKRRMRINGIPVRGTINEVPEIVKKYSISEIIVAVPGLHGERRNEIVSICKQTHCRTRTLTDPKDTARPMAIRELNTSDFLSRDEVELDNHLIEAYLTDKVVMVTGGGGSIGSEICRQIIRFKPKQLLIFDVYENCAYELECELKQKYGADIPIKVLIGSIRDRVRLDNVFETYQPSVVFHAAAHKHVPLMEVSPAEAIKNNVFGTKNLLESAEAHGVRRFVQLSTDKAVNPTNVMGATKRITEMLLQECARRGKMKCMAVRFGNVLGSHGSVIPLFEAQIKKGGPVTLTHPDITRYFMTIPEAAQLVLQAGGLANPGAIYVLDMGEPVKIIDLAKKLIRFYGYEPDVDIPIKIVGLRPGEKLYEELLMDSERDKMTHTAHNKIFVAPP